MPTPSPSNNACDAAGSSTATTEVNIPAATIMTSSPSIPDTGAPSEEGSSGGNEPFCARLVTSASTALSSLGPRAELADRGSARASTATSTLSTGSSATSTLATTVTSLPSVTSTSTAPTTLVTSVPTTTATSIPSATASASDVGPAMRAGGTTPTPAATAPTTTSAIATAPATCVSSSPATTAPSNLSTSTDANATASDIGPAMRPGGATPTPAAAAPVIPSAISTAACVTSSPTTTATATAPSDLSTSPDAIAPDISPTISNSPATCVTSAPATTTTSIPSASATATATTPSNLSTSPDPNASASDVGPAMHASGATPTPAAAAPVIPSATAGDVGPAMRPSGATPTPTAPAPVIQSAISTAPAQCVTSSTKHTSCATSATSLPLKEHSSKECFELLLRVDPSHERNAFEGAGGELDLPKIDAQMHSERLKKFRESKPVKEIVAYLERPNDAAKANGHVPVAKIEGDTHLEVLRHRNAVAQFAHEIPLTDCEACGLFDVDFSGDTMRLREVPSECHLVAPSVTSGDVSDTASELSRLNISGSKSDISTSDVVSPVRRKFNLAKEKSPTKSASKRSKSPRSAANRLQNLCAGTKPATTPVSPFSSNDHDRDRTPHSSQRKPSLPAVARLRRGSVGSRRGTPGGRSDGGQNVSATLADAHSGTEDDAVRRPSGSGSANRREVHAQGHTAHAVGPSECLVGGEDCFPEVPNADSFLDFFAVDSPPVPSDRASSEHPVQSEHGLPGHPESSIAEHTTSSLTPPEVDSSSDSSSEGTNTCVLRPRSLHAADEVAKKLNSKECSRTQAETDPNTRRCPHCSMVFHSTMFQDKRRRYKLCFVCRTAASSTRGQTNTSGGSDSSEARTSESTTSSRSSEGSRKCQFREDGNFPDLSARGYTCDRLIGAGAYGVVFAGRKLNGKTERVALKVLCCALNDQVRVDALNEAAILKRFHHPTIVAYRDHFELHDHVVIVMEFVHGNSIYECVQAGRRLGPADGWRLLIDAARAMAHFHLVTGGHFMHTDLSSSNIIWMVSGGFKVIDLGLAVLKASHSGFCGTRDFIAPEIVEERKFSPSADQWSIAAVALVGLLGEPSALAGGPELSHKLAEAGCDEEFIDLMLYLVEHNSENRISFDRWFGHPRICNALGRPMDPFWALAKHERLLLQRFGDEAAVRATTTPADRQPRADNHVSPNTPTIPAGASQPTAATGPGNDRTRGLQTGRTRASRVLSSAPQSEPTRANRNPPDSLEPITSRADSSRSATRKQADPFAGSHPAATASPGSSQVESTRSDLDAPDGAQPASIRETMAAPTRADVLPSIPEEHPVDYPASGEVAFGPSEVASVSESEPSDENKRDADPNTKYDVHTSLEAAFHRLPVKDRETLKSLEPKPHGDLTSHLLQPASSSRVSLDPLRPIPARRADRAESYWMLLSGDDGRGDLADIQEALEDANRRPHSPLQHAAEREAAVLPVNEVDRVKESCGRHIEKQHKSLIVTTGNPKDQNPGMSPPGLSRLVQNVNDRESAPGIVSTSELEQPEQQPTRPLMTAAGSATATEAVPNLPELERPTKADGAAATLGSNEARLIHNTEESARLGHTDDSESELDFEMNDELERTLDSIIVRELEYGFGDELENEIGCDHVQQYERERPGHHLGDELDNELGGAHTQRFEREWPGRHLGDELNNELGGDNAQRFEREHTQQQQQQREAHQLEHPVHNFSDELNRESGDDPTKVERGPAREGPHERERPERLVGDELDNEFGGAHAEQFEREPAREGKHDVHELERPVRILSDELGGDPNQEDEPEPAREGPHKRERLGRLVRDTPANQSREHEGQDFAAEVSVLVEREQHSWAAPSREELQREEPQRAPSTLQDAPSEQKFSLEHSSTASTHSFSANGAASAATNARPPIDVSAPHLRTKSPLQPHPQQQQRQGRRPRMFGEPALQANRSTAFPARDAGGLRGTRPAHEAVGARGALSGIRKVDSSLTAYRKYEQEEDYGAVVAEEHRSQQLSSGWQEREPHHRCQLPPGSEHEPQRRHQPLSGGQVREPQRLYQPLPGEEVREPHRRQLPPGSEREPQRWHQPLPGGQMREPQRRHQPLPGEEVREPHRRELPPGSEREPQRRHQPLPGEEVCESQLRHQPLPGEEVRAPQWRQSEALANANSRVPRSQRIESHSRLADARLLAAYTAADVVDTMPPPSRHGSQPINGVEPERTCCAPHRSGLRTHLNSEAELAANRAMLQRIFPAVPRCCQGISPGPVHVACRNRECRLSPEEHIFYRNLSRAASYLPPHHFCPTYDPETGTCATARCTKVHDRRNGGPYHCRSHLEIGKRCRGRCNKTHNYNAREENGVFCPTWSLHDEIAL